MTISYVDDVSNGQGICIIFKLLARWRGSLFKLVWMDIFIYVAAYYILNLTYRFAMSENQKQIFEAIVLYCGHSKADIPISFLLGFFVSGIIARWYQMFLYIPWMNEVALHLSACVNGNTLEGARRVRLHILRYMNLSWIVLMRTVSEQISVRFQKLQANGQDAGTRTPRCCEQEQNISNEPWNLDTYEIVDENKSKFKQSPVMHLPKKGQVFDEADPFEERDENREKINEASGNLLRSFNEDKKVHQTFGKLITESEVAAFQRIAWESFKRSHKTYGLDYWVPIQWAQTAVLKAFECGYITDAKVAYITVGMLGNFRKKMQDLQIFSVIMIPLVYTQVVIIAVYSYFLCQLMATQFVRQDPNAKHNLDLYVPVFNIFSFLFLMGWLKVALCVMNPFGDDDEDFPTSEILDYNLETSYRMSLAEEEFFPKFLSAPSLGKSRLPDANNEFEIYLALAYEEITAAIPEVEPENIVNLEYRPSKLRCLKSCCSRYDPAKDQHTIL